MEPRIEKYTAFTLAGYKLEMSFSNNRVGELWRKFMPVKSQIPALSEELYAVEVYPDTSFFSSFDPNLNFEKWAAVPVSDVDKIPPGFSVLNVPAGLYAVFLYKGKPSQAASTYQYIYSKWIPQSDYTLDDRPHLAIMGEQYKGEHPESEEELWIPIRPK